MTTMDASLQRIYNSGMITKEEAINRAHNKDDFKRMVGEAV